MSDHRPKMPAPQKISFHLPQHIHLEGFDILVKDEIGRGGFGSVYTAEYQGLAYAMKLYRMWEVLPSERDDLLQRIFQEYKISEKIDSPHVVKIFNYQEVLGNPLLMMEYCEGGSLRDLIGQPLGDHEILKITEDICNGLAAMHENDIVHRDIKPENILLKQQNYALSDFGISVSLHKRLTQTDIRGRVKQIFASAAYSPPEQVSGELAFKNIGPTNDIYALGVVLYELLTQGHLPFGSFEQYAHDPIKYEKKKKHEDWDYGRLMDTQVKAFWKNIIVQCLKPQAQQRFQNVGEILDLLSQSDFSSKHTPIKRSSTKKNTDNYNDWTLTIISNELKSQVFYISRLAQNKNKAKLTVGLPNHAESEYNDICIESRKVGRVSAFHATLEKYMEKQGQEQWYLRDGQWYKKDGVLDWYLSKEGVYVNGIKVGKYGIALHNGDVIEIGKIKLTFQEA